MGEIFMGQELTQPELPANSPRPAETPPDGVIVTDITPDGWTRRYLYTSYMGQAEELLLREIPPERMSGEATYVEEPARMSGAAIPIEPQPPLRAAPQAPAPAMQTTGMPFTAQPKMHTVSMRPVSQPVMQPAASVMPKQAPVPAVAPAPAQMGAPQSLMLRNAADPLRMASAALGMSRTPAPSLPVGGPTGLMQKNLALQTESTPRIGPAGLGASQRANIAAPASRSLVLAPKLGQIQPPSAPQAPAAPPAPPSSAPLPPPQAVATKCPGPVELTDGHVIEPEDYIKLSDLCELVPFLVESELQAKAKQIAAKAGVSPGQALSLVGQQQGSMSAVGAGSPFGGQGGGGGGGGGGFGGFGGGGGPGPAGPPGLPGTAGPAGPPGPGTATDFLIKTDGDFTVGPGAFVAVPGTLLAFTTPSAGAAVFLLQAVLGCGNSQNAVIGLRIDGVDFPLNPRLLHTFVAGVSEFFIPVHASFPQNLAAGSHTVQVILRGISAGEFCAASGFGVPATVSANPGTPLALTVLHQGPSMMPPAAAVPVINGVNKMDGNFNSGSVVPVPGTQINFTVTTPGNAFFAISGNVVPVIGFVQVWNAILGIRIDGTDYLLAETSEVQGSGTDRDLTSNLAGSITLPMTSGPHSAQLLYGNQGGVNQLQLVGSVSQPATLSVIHT